MKSLETQIDINASAEKVWNVLLNFSEYPKWNPFIQHISGDSEKGGKLLIKIGLGKKPTTFKPTILTSEKQKEFRWLGRLLFPGLFDGEHYFILKETKNGVSLIHGEKFKGVLAGVLLRMIGKDTINGFNEMNKALKLEVESI